MAMMNCSMDSNLNLNKSEIANYSVSNPTGDGVINANYHISGWDYWRDYYYPYVIRESYPVYIKERAEDKGKQAFEIIKVLKDKRFLNLEKVGDFIDLMDELIKIL